jgi:exosome complex component RRP41
MRDLVASCAAGKMENNLILDLGDYEDKEGQADVPVAYMPKLEKVTLLQMDGILSTDEFEKCIDMAIEGCKQIYEVQRESLKKKYGVEEKEAEE